MDFAKGSLIVCFTCLCFFACPLQAADIYTFDPAHTDVRWHVNFFRFFTVSGKFSAEGTVAVDEAKPQRSKVHVIIHIATLSTGIAKLDEILKGKDFFYFKQFPTATFESSQVIVSGKETGKVYGTLTLRGVARPVVLDVKLDQFVIAGRKQKIANFTVNAIVRRSDFEMKSYWLGVSDQVKIDITAVANRAG